MVRCVLLERLSQMCVRTRTERDILRSTILRKPFCKPCVIYNRDLTKGLEVGEKRTKLESHKEGRNMFWLIQMSLG